MPQFEQSGSVATRSLFMTMDSADTLRLECGDALRVTRNPQSHVEAHFWGCRCEAGLCNPAS